MRRLGLLWLCAIALLLPWMTAKAQGEGIQGRIAFAAFVNGNWDIYSIGADGRDLRRHTFGPADDLAPSWSPDGQCLAFQSHRDGNWEIYRLCREDREPTRLTHHLAFDGRPAWSPAGARIAFDSFRSGDLDIFLMNADGEKVVNLTEDSPAGDFGPAWSLDGERLAFTSWRYGDPGLFIIPSEGGDVRQLTDIPGREADPTWSPAGSLAYAAYTADESSEVYRLDIGHPPEKGRRGNQLTWWGGVESPVWSPDGAYLAALWRRYDGEILIILDAEGGVPQRLTPAAMLTGPLSWTASPLGWGQQEDPGSLTDPRWQVSPVGNHELVTLTDVDVSNPRLNSALVAPFNEFRQAIKEKSGYDFLSSLSDMWRNPGFINDTSDYLSWHKAGRAMDLLWDYRASDSTPLLEITPQVLGGQTYWRLYLRCRDQSGRQGQPLTVQTWDFSYQARVVEAPDKGGSYKDVVPYGYYIDLTTLARQYGWERISSYDQPGLHWHESFMALEYWHLQQRGGQTWYQAMQEVYRPGVLQHYFHAAAVEAGGEDPWRIVAKGIPYPPDGRPWWALER